MVHPFASAGLAKDTLFAETLRAQKANRGAQWLELPLAWKDWPRAMLPILDG